MVGRHVAAWTLCSLLLGCAHHALPDPPEARAIASQEPCDGMTFVDPVGVRALLVQGYARDATISPEGAPSPLVKMVTVVEDSGRLTFNDIVHRPAPSQALTHCKLDPGSLSVEAVAGQLDGNYLFTPTRDVLVSIDSGFGLVVRAGQEVEQLIVAPNYDTSAYRPYSRVGRDKPPAASGHSPGGGGYAAGGVNGGAGEDGDPGEAGADGANGRPGANGAVLGQSGGDGGAGGDGGDGSSGLDGADGRSAGASGGDGGDGTDGGTAGHGSHGGSGVPGQDAQGGDDGDRGQDGPLMEIVLRPIYSRFYPDEELVFAEVDTTWHTNQGEPYKTETQNYIFHRRQPFVFTSTGGDGGQGGRGGRGGPGGSGGDGGAGGDGGKGGDGGDGGRGGPGDKKSGTAAGQMGQGGDGGDGGNGGNGGNGGHGASAGCSGDGGNGGRGGDGGHFAVSIAGSGAFSSDVQRAIEFRSVPGDGGVAGARGAPRSPSAGGSRGGVGSLGKAGGAGNGAPRGSAGAKGKVGEHPGQNGRRGRANGACRPGDGMRGPAGVPIRPEFRRMN
jgi:hypothetical protein